MEQYDLWKLDKKLQKEVDEDPDVHIFPAFLSIPPGRLPRQELFSYYNTNLV